MLAAWFGIVGWSLGLGERRARVLREAAETLDLEPDLGPPDRPASFVGTVRGFEVTIWDQRDALVQVLVTDGRCAELEFGLRDRLSAEVLSQHPWRALTGDWEFDSTVVVTGNIESVLAILGPDVRTAVARMLSSGGEVTRDRITRRVPGPIRTPEEVVSAVRDVVSLARLLVAPEDSVGGLIRSALHDPVPGFRARCIEALGQRHTDDARVADAFSRCLDDPCELVRLATAGGPLPPAGHATVLTLAHAVLARGPNPDEMELELAALRALGALGGEEAERSLVVALNAVEPELRRAAALALGTSGSTRAIPALRAAAAAHNDDWPLLNAVTATVVAIQERATGAAPGQLALAGGEAGEVALAEGVDTGRVALTEGES